MAAAEGDAKATFNLATLHLKGLGGLTADAEKAAELFRLAEEGGYSAGSYHLGLCYLHGKGVAQNEETALLHFLKVRSAQGRRNTHVCVGIHW